MQIDRFLPEYDFVERHEVRVAADVDTVYSSLQTLDLGSSGLVRLLFRMRGMPGAALRLDGMERMGFVRLADIAGAEVVLGLVGRFWTLRGDVVCMAPDDFASFEEPGFAKAAWNFSMQPLEDGSALLATETRVRCTDPGSRRRFARYWFLVRPFSGLIRRVALRSIRRSAEGALASQRSDGAARPEAGLSG